jgi:molybdopterin converting factor small subunit
MDVKPIDTPFIVHVHLFARARELAGTGTVAVELPRGASVGQLRSALADRVPALRGLLPRSRIAINHDFAADGCGIGPTDEVAVVPPVSGG